MDKVRLGRFVNGDLLGFVRDPPGRCACDVGWMYHIRISTASCSDSLVSVQSSWTLNEQSVDTTAAGCLGGMVTTCDKGFL